MFAGKYYTACFRYSGLSWARVTLALNVTQEDDANVLHLTAATLLFDGRSNEAAFEMMQSEGAFTRLVDLIRDKRDDDNGLHKVLLELLFEMSRMQQLTRDDLSEYCGRFGSFIEH